MVTLYNALTSENVKLLRKVGFTDAQIVALLGILQNCIESKMKIERDVLEKAVDERLGKENE